MTSWDNSDWVKNDAKALFEVSEAWPRAGWDELGRKFDSLTSLRAIKNPKPALMEHIRALEFKRRGREPSPPLPPRKKKKKNAVVKPPVQPSTKPKSVAQLPRDSHGKFLARAKAKSKELVADSSDSDESDIVVVAYFPAEPKTEQRTPSPSPDAIRPTRSPTPLKPESDLHLASPARPRPLSFQPSPAPPPSSIPRSSKVAVRPSRASEQTDELIRLQKEIVEAKEKLFELMVERGK